MGGSVRPQVLTHPLPQPCHAKGEDPLTIEALEKTVLKFKDRSLLDGLTQVASPSRATLHAMQQLVELIKKLRSLEQEQQFQQPSTLEDLIPYISDEVDEILEALQASSKPASSEVTAFVLLESLIPELLWCVARSAYATMQLLEGIQVLALPPDQDGVRGILRLAVILEVETSGMQETFDLAMGSPAQPALNREWLIQADVDSALHLDWLDCQINTEHGETLARSPSCIDQQLRQLTHQLVATEPILQSWVQGITIDCLPPAQTWQSAFLRLRLDFAFMPYPIAEPFTNQLAANHPIEAELLEDLETSTSEAVTGSARASIPPAIEPVTVVEMPLPPLFATTIVRLTDPTTLETFANLATQQELVRSINSLRLGLVSSSQADSLLLVQEATRIADLTYQSASTNFCLLQPELLIDELIPKLLWHVTRSSFTAMKWLGGMDIVLLQPGATWQAGILRLMIVLELQTSENRWFIDLAAGRFISLDNWTLTSGAITQLHPPAASEVVTVEQIQTQLQQSIHAAAPEITCLEEGVVVEYLTADHDWQAGRLTLHTGLEFIPNLF